MKGKDSRRLIRKVIETIGGRALGFCSSAGGSRGRRVSRGGSEREAERRTGTWSPAQTGDGAEVVKLLLGRRGADEP